MSISKVVKNVIAALEPEINKIHYQSRESYRRNILEYLQEVKIKDGDLATGIVKALERYLNK
jgi:hypothetical protein